MRDVSALLISPEFDPPSLFATCWIRRDARFTRGSTALGAEGAGGGGCGAEAATLKASRMAPIRASFGPICCWVGGAIGVWAVGEGVCVLLPKPALIASSRTAFSSTTARVCARGGRWPHQLVSTDNASVKGGGWICVGACVIVTGAGAAGVDKLIPPLPLKAARREAANEEAPGLGSPNDDTAPTFADGCWI